MRLAVPEFNGRVSPVFDFCRKLVIIDPGEDGHFERFCVDWSEGERIDRARRLRELKVDILLCGGISCELAWDVARKGIRVFPWISGNTGEVLEAFLAGKLPDPRLTMPGCPKSRGPREGWPRGWGACRGRGRGPR